MVKKGKVLPEQVALVGTGLPGGGASWGKYIRRFLEENGVRVDFFDGSLFMLREVRKERLNPQLGGRPILERVVQEIARVIRERAYPAVITVEREDVLLQDLAPNTRRIFFCQASLSYERYYRWIYQGDPEAEKKLQQALQVERSIYQAADAVVFTWNVYEQYIRKHIYDGENIVSHPGLGWFGCEHDRERVDYVQETGLVFLGHIDYWSNPAMIARLTGIAPFPVHCYGKTHVPVNGINHLGFARDEVEIYKKYNFGLNMVSTDPLRQAALSSKVMTYLSVGLPVFSPAWQQFSHQLAGVVPFEMDEVVDLVLHYHQPDIWRSLSDAAYEQAQELRWDKVLLPLLDILSG